MKSKKFLHWSQVHLWYEKSSISTNISFFTIYLNKSLDLRYKQHTNPCFKYKRSVLYIVIGLSDGHSGTTLQIHRIFPNSLSLVRSPIYEVDHIELSVFASGQEENSTNERCSSKRGSKYALPSPHVTKRSVVAIMRSLKINNF